MTEAYPLSWPAGKSRARTQETARFDISQERAQNGIIKQIQLIGGSLPVISTNIPLRRDGMPYTNYRQPTDKGVAIYFSLRGQQMCFACDRWDTIKDNMQAIHKTIEALRGIERWGSGDMVQQAFTGFMALPAPISPEEILNVRSGASHDEIETAYRAMAKVWHPDKLGGSEAKMKEINEARRRLLA